MKLLPHRSPFLFVDTLVSADETGAVAEYTFTEEKNDFFKGHFPGYPIVPGVVLVETMAQAAGAGLVARDFFHGEHPSFVLAKVEEAKFRRPVRPGDKFVTVAMNGRVRTAAGNFNLKGYVNGELAAEAKVMCMLGGGR
ncbi:MAG: 3-hydroxyacyl-ACP dehydratase FabZ [Kiritimatiellae bacterium]|nr:3-hydroxyacyl-ACP dehydratase FabZ [Kiritimatiellia bacterium]